MKKRTIQFNKRNISIITPQITHNYYIPKNLPSHPYIRLPSRIPKIARSSSPISLNTLLIIIAINNLTQMIYLE